MDKKIFHPRALPPRQPWISPALRARAQSMLPPEELTFKQVNFVLLLHLPLMLVFRALPILATLHSVIVLGLGLHFLIRDERPHRILWVLGYLAGAEILWRGIDATLIWEYGKFATIGLVFLALVRYRLLSKATLWPLILFALLLPGILIMPYFDREAISFQLAGLVALGLVTLLCSALEIKKADLQRIFLAILAPNISMGALIFVSLFAGEIAYSGGGANEEITGGIGANQVTSSLSLGASAAFFYIFLASKDARLRNLMIILALGLTVVSVLTFSRAGLWNTLGVVVVALFFLLRDRWRSSTAINLLLSLGVLAYFVIFPFLVNLTGGALIARFSNFDSTGRDVLAQIDYDVFLQNPEFGVGVGQSVYYHIPYFGYAKPTHTEYTRLLAEHGSFGIGVIILLLGVPISRALGRRSAFDKAVALGLMAWALLYFTHSATRTVAPSFAFGLALAHFFIGDEDSSAPTTDPAPAPSRQVPRSSHLRTQR